MLSPIASGFVGLIVIESTVASDELIAKGVANDATLGGILRWLAGGQRGGFAGGLPEQPRTPNRRRRAVGRSTPWMPRSGLNIGSNGPALVAADCRGLGEQLERATRQLRRRIAQAHADGR